MTLATGKSGKYRYYRCCNKMAISAKSCPTPNLPMDRMDALILERLVDRILTPERVMTLLKEWLSNQAKMKGRLDEDSARLERSILSSEDGLNNLYRGIEQGVLALDSTLQARVNQLKDTREKLLGELALIKRDQPSPRKLSSKQVEYACQRMREMLLDRTQGYGKQLLHLLVSEIRVQPGEAVITGSTEVLNKAVLEMKKGTSVEVPSLMRAWRARSDSNARPLGS